LHSAAAADGCSLNAYALQVLASAAGDAARFRSGTITVGDEPRDIARGERGIPLKPKDRGEHLRARQEYFEAMAAESGAVAADRLVRQYEADDPGFFVEWSHRKAG